MPIDRDIKRVMEALLLGGALALNASACGGGEEEGCPGEGCPGETGDEGCPADSGDEGCPAE